MFLVNLEDDIRAGLAKIEGAVYQPTLVHPLLDAVRAALVAEIQSHMGAVGASAANIANVVLHQVEDAILAQQSPPAPPST